MLTLFGFPGGGSTVVEAVCALLDEPYEYVVAEPWMEGPNVDRLRAANPLVQVPTVVLPDGTVLTESAAILLWLVERHPGCGLGPGPGEPGRTEFLRWMVFLPAAVYPMYTMGDFPGRWVEDEEHQSRLKAATVARTLACWRLMERDLNPSGPYLLGASLSVLDLYAAMMSHWRPGRDRIREVAPQVIAACEAAEAHPKIAPIWARNFPAHG